MAKAYWIACYRSISNPDALAATLEALTARTVPGARLVCVDWRTHGPERPLTASPVNDEVRRAPWLRRLTTECRPEYLLDGLERRGVRPTRFWSSAAARRVSRPPAPIAMPGRTGPWRS